MGGGGSGSSSADDWNLGPAFEGVQVGGPFGGGEIILPEDAYIQ